MKSSDSGALNARTCCCIVGGGPAGIVTGFLLARAGIDVIVLEKHADFFRDFRGDTIHPSTLRLIDDLGLLDEFLTIPHSQLTKIAANISGRDVPVADFARIPGPCKFIALMPQWDFLTFFADHARRFPTFRLMMNTQAIDILQVAGTVCGVRATTPQGEIDISANLVIAADGRSSILRTRAALDVVDVASPIDVLWLRLPKRPTDSAAAFGYVGPGGLLVAIDRTTYFQCGLIIAKGDYDRVRSAGIEALRMRIATLAPLLAPAAGSLASFDDVKLLTVKIDRLRKWYLPGLLCIGDAAHAMSPIGGVGINLAVADAVATANILMEPLQHGRPPSTRLAAVQRRRMLPARVIQTGQAFVQSRLLLPLLSTSAQIRVPRLLRLLSRFPQLQRIPAYIVGMGIRPERLLRTDTVRH